GLLAACGQPASETSAPDAAEVRPEPVVPGPSGPETRLQNIKQLTFSGQNAEAYFSADGSLISFKSMEGDQQCDQIYTRKLDGSDARLASTGEGAMTCGYIYPDNQSVIYGSTHLAGDACPARPDMSQGYVWAIYDSYDIFNANIDGSNPVRLTDTP